MDRQESFSFSNIRTFIGAKDYKKSISFYETIGWEIVKISDKMSLVKVDDTHAFYLQKYYVRKWVENSMVFLEVDDVDSCYAYFHSLNLPTKFPGVKLSDITPFEWGREIFLHDPSGVLWHLCEFNK